MAGRDNKRTSGMRSQIWFIPMMAILGTTVLALLTTALDRQLAGTGVFDDLFARNPEAVRTALSVVASSMLTFTALVFTITMVVVQQAANRLSPRVMGTFLEDRMSQVTLGVFTGTFAYSLLVLRDVRSPSEGVSFVPGLSVAIVFLAVFASLGVFVAYLHHITQSLRIGRVARRIANETRATIDRIYPKDRQHVSNRDETGNRPGRTLLWDGEAGHLQQVDHDSLLEQAVEHGLDIDVLRQVGEFIPFGSPIMRVEGSSDEIDTKALTSALKVGESRSGHGDVTFGIRQLVDIAEKALSPAMNDPTTAVEALDRIHDLLRRLAERPIPSQLVYERDGSYVTVESPDWEQIVRLSIEEIKHYGDNSLQVTRRLERMIEDLVAVVSEDRAAALKRHLATSASERQDRSETTQPDDGRRPEEMSHARRAEA